MKFTKGPCGDRHHTSTETERSGLYLASLMCPAALKHSSLQPLHFLPEWTLYIIDHTAQPIPEKAVSSIIHLVCLHNTDVTLTSWPEQPLVRRCSAYVMVLEEVAWAYPGTGRWETTPPHSALEKQAHSEYLGWTGIRGRKWTSSPRMGCVLFQFIRIKLSKWCCPEELFPKETWKRITMFQVGSIYSFKW